MLSPHKSCTILLFLRDHNYDLTTLLIIRLPVCLPDQLTAGEGTTSERLDTMEANKPVKKRRNRKKSLKLDQSAQEETIGSSQKAEFNAEGITSRYGRRIRRIEKY